MPEKLEVTLAPELTSALAELVRHLSQRFSANNEILTHPKGPPKWPTFFGAVGLEFLDQLPIKQQAKIAAAVFDVIAVKLGEIGAD